MLRLIDVTGMRAFEQECRDYALGRMMRPEIEAFEALLERQSFALFGITLDDTSYWGLPDDTRPRSHEEWEQHFEFLEWEYDEEEAFWSAVGLDIRDDDGKELVALNYIGRQLICALKGLHPKAAPTFLNGEKTDEQLQAEAEAWALARLRRNKDATRG